MPVPVVECYATPNYHRSLTTSRYSTVCYLETLSDTSDLSDTSESSEDTSAYYGGQKDGGLASLGREIQGEAEGGSSHGRPSFIAAGRCRDERIGARARRQTRARASERGRAEWHAIERKANPMRVRT